MSSKRLKRITVRGFKSIRELEDFEIQPLNILIGGNGAGKSNFIQVFELLHAIEQERLGVYSLQQGIDSLLYYGRKHTEGIDIELSFGNINQQSLENAYHIRLVPTQKETLVFEQEEAFFHDKQRYPDRPYQVPLGSGHPETQLKASDEKVAKQVFQVLSTWRVYHFHDTSDKSPMKGFHDLHDNHRLFTDGANVAAFLRFLEDQHPANYQQIEQVVRLAAPFFDDFVFNEQDTVRGKEIRLGWRDKSSFDTTFSGYDLSDGTIRFIALATLLLQPEETLPSVILIDEPELGLHPYAITLLAELLDMASKRAQVIVSTQSVPLVNQFSPENIVVVDRRDKQSTFERLDPAKLEHWLDDYGVGDLWEKNIIGGKPQPEF